MKNRIWANLRVNSFPSFSHLARGVSLGICILALSGCMKEGSFSGAETPVAAAEVTPLPGEDITNDVVAQTGDTDVQETVAQADQQGISNAPTKKVFTEIQVPASLKPSSATAEIIKLANAGVEERVMLSFVTNSQSTFNLRAEEIIYLKDIGVPSGVVTAMIQRDHLLQGTASNVAITTAEPEPPIAIPTPPVYGPDTPTTVAETAPMPDYTVPVEPERSVVDYSDYYDALAPYGSWVDVEGVGRCWQPTVVVVDRGWQPYFNCGRWVYSDCGWYWMSDYSWGWAPFHYGRWFQHGQLGWCWRPDQVWGPSWVCWRRTGDYCGWAPLPPCATFSAGIGLTFRGHSVGHNFAFGLGADHFRFIHTSRFMDRDVARHVLPRDHSARIYDRTIASTGIIDHNHRVSNLGIPREHVASAVHGNILPVTLHNVTPSEGGGIRERFERNGRTLTVYRPEMRPRTPSRTPGISRDSQRPLNSGLVHSGTPNRINPARVQSNTPQTTPTTALPGRTDTTARSGQPLILRGSDHSSQAALAPAPNATQNTRRAVPLNSVVIGQNRDSRFASTQTDSRPSSSSHNRTSSSHNRDFRDTSSQQVAREWQTRSDFHQPRTSPQPNWAQPQQPRTSEQQQFRHNRDTSVLRGGSWNATVDSPRHNPTPTYHNPAPVQVPAYTHQTPIQSRQLHSVPVEPRPMQTAPVETRQARPVPMESHPSRQMSVESHQSRPAPAVSHSSPPAATHSPAASSSSSSRDSSSHSSGRGR